VMNFLCWLVMVSGMFLSCSCVSYFSVQGIDPQSQFVALGSVSDHS
jgi:hypothetical protein